MMTDAGNTPDSPAPATQSQTSAMAIIAIVLALLPLCVPLNLIGTVLGFVAKRRIVAAGGRLRGHGAARAAIWGGLIMTVLGWWVWSEIGQWTQRAIEETAGETTTAFLQEVADGRSQAAFARWSSNADMPSDTHVDSFARAVAQLGTVQSVGIVSMQPMPDTDIWQPVWSAWLVITIGDAKYDGSAQYELQPEAGSITPRPMLREFTLDAPNGQLSLPEVVGEPSP
ncbi:MAG: DUF4190 domain-containing protein [Phycisphaerae bacterium]|nr:DUF4190 domain-containing protein [Phycisphaerae bacterium]